MNSLSINQLPTDAGTSSLSQIGLDVRDKRPGLTNVVVSKATESGAPTHSLQSLAQAVGGAQVHASSKFDPDKTINSTLPKMPASLMVATHVDRNTDVKKRIVTKPAMNIILVSPMHHQYDEASTMAVKLLVKTKFEEENFFRYQHPKYGPQPAPVDILTLYEDTMIWPLKANAIWWAAGIPSASRYLQECFGALRFSQGGTQKSVSILEAFHGPMHILLNSAFSGTLLAQMVAKGAYNPTICLANLNGPVVDPTVSAATAMASALNIPVTMWKDDTQSGYGGADNPLLMGLGSNQSVYHGYIPSGNPLRMFQGMGNFRWVGPGGLTNPCTKGADGKWYAKGTKSPCDIGNAFDMTYAASANTYSYMGTPATPVQGVQQEKSGQVLLSPTLMDTLKESIWYGLANPQAMLGQNEWISPPIPRSCDSSKCTPANYGTDPISLPFSARYGKLLAFGTRLMTTRLDDSDSSFTDVYNDHKDSDHTVRTWSLRLAQDQWKFILKAIKDIVYEGNQKGDLYGELLMYFDPRDVIDMHFLFSFLADGCTYDQDKKCITEYIEPIPIQE